MHLENTSSAEQPIKQVLRMMRQVVGASVIETAFTSLARISRWVPFKQPKHFGIEVLQDIPYTTSGLAEHTLDIYKPKDVKNPPVVLYVHGGGFWMLSKNTHWLMALAYALRGYMVVNINYRLAPKYRYPAAIEDVCAAYVWLTKNIAAHGGDTKRVILAGESAGANLITSLMLCTNFEREEAFAKAVFETEVVPKVVIPACGILQCSDTQRFLQENPKLFWLHYDRMREVESYYLHGSPAIFPTLPPLDLDLANPLHVLERGEKAARPLPAFFIPVGNADPLISDSRRLDAALQKYQVPCKTRFYPKMGHAFHAYIWRKQAQRCWQDTFEFLQETLKD